LASALPLPSVSHFADIEHPASALIEADLSAALELALVLLALA
jgi:hypothetical protein